MLMNTSPSNIITVRQKQEQSKNQKKNEKPTMIRWRCVYCNQIVEGKDYQELYNQIVSLKVSDSYRCHAFRNIANITSLTDMVMLTESAVPSLSVMTKLPKPPPNIWGTPVGMR
jgi:hypothetical protein